MRRALAVLELVRPANLAIAAAAVALGARFGGAGVDAARLAAAALVLAGGYAWNDADDAPRDRIAHPGRPVPSGRLARRHARGIAIALLGTGLVVGAWLPPPVAGLLGVWALLLVAYRPLGDRVPVAKNLVASGLTASALLLGGLGGPAPGATLFPALFAFLLSWIRETIKDLADREGDRSVGRPSWIDSLEPARARDTLRAMILLLGVLIPVPVIWLGYELAYLAVAAMGVGGALFWLDRRLGREPPRSWSAEALAGAAWTLKGSMVAGLVALFLGAPA